MTDHPESIAYCHACGAPMDVSAVAPFTNVECPKCAKHTRVKREFGPYTLVRRHAIGGMSMVFVAHDNTLDREVALKILSEEFSADERRIAAFEEEARITASFSHPHVVRVLTTGRSFGRFYIAMELVPGGHFEHQIRERGKIPEIEMLPLAIEVAQGLKAAHAAGLIHRDVKPGNILLDAEGHAKLVDFGLALVTQGGKAQATELWATPYYVPPETVEGYVEDFRSDIYAFGATLYHALAGQPSCGEESMATDVLREAKKRVKPLSAVEHSVSAETCRIVEKAMAYAPDARYSSYDEMIASLAVALSHLKSGRSETTGSVAKRRAVKKRKERSLIIACLVGLALLVAGILFALNRSKPVPVVDATPAVDVVPPPMVADTSAEIGKSYREARDAVAAKDFQKASVRFTDLHKNPDVQEPTRSWAGVEAVLAAFLDGRPTDGRRQAREVMDHIRSLPENSNRIGGGMVGTLGKLGDLNPLPTPEAKGGGAAQVVSAMLTGLKNWEQGLLEPASVCFKAATSVKLNPNDQWAEVYQKMANDYLTDYQLLTGPLFAEFPSDKAGCDAAMDELNRVLATLKTRGRAKFNVRAWQLDLARHGKLLSSTPTTDPAPDDSPVAENPPVKPLKEVMAMIDGFVRMSRFSEAVTYLKSLPADPPGATRASLLSVAESSAVFLADLEEDLAKGPVTAELLLKSGETATTISLDGDKLSITNAAGQSRTCTWADFSPDALIALHRVFVKTPKNEFERLRRHECAISYDWLAGNRERALNAANVLSTSSTAFKQRWDSIATGLPK
jgi:tRNA A-37 threonylcarbamoyl transferase component Bud32